MYSNHYRFIYVRVPKAASTSITNLLMPLTGYQVTRIKWAELARLQQNKPREALWHHAPLYEYYRALGAEARSWFAFTFVRNPWTRLVSAYFYYRQLQARGADTLAFKPWCLMHRVLRYQYNNCHWHTQPVLYDFVGRVETLQTDFDCLCDRIGLARATLPHYNAFCHSDYRQYYDDETRALVARKYARDIDLFNYTF